MIDTKKYLAVIYGKKGCPLCVKLKANVYDIITEEKYKDKIGMVYHDLSTSEGLIEYAKSETINGQRIPAMQIFEKSYDGSYVKKRDTRPEFYNEETGKLFVPVYLQVQTDYTIPKYAEIKENQIKELFDLSINA